MTARVVLASSSLRRRALLASAGFSTVAIAPLVDDGSLRVRAQTAKRDCVALAWFKAAQVMNNRALLESAAPHAYVLVAADTVCVLGTEVMGKPATADEARRMLTATMGRTQCVVTGVCLVDLRSGERTLLADAAHVQFGEMSKAQLDDHIAHGAWQGRAGGYNIEEVAKLGWPVSWTGDQTTITGLPISLLTPVLKKMLLRGMMPE
ncbi:MAG: Maf-like protein [Phycisphaerales bacterium]|nr:Maf-like protein [Phycisphaerales bacterium]